MSDAEWPRGAEAADQPTAGPASDAQSAITRRESGPAAKLVWMETSGPNGLDLRTAIGLMQEAALVLERPRAGTPGQTARYANDRAAHALGMDVSAVPGRTLVELLPADTATALSSLCDWVVQSRKPVEHFASAPDALTDLTGMPSTVVRVTEVYGLLLCTWIPGWHRVGDDEERSRSMVAGTPVADRLELAAAVDALASTGFGMFSFDMTNGRLVMSSGMYRILALEGRAPVVDTANLQSLVDLSPELRRAWRALIHRGEPMQVDVRLVPRLGGGTLRILACASLGHDHRPVVVRGCCRLLNG